MLEWKKEFMMFAHAPDRNLSVLCQRYHVSRKTAYQWLAQFQEAQAAGEDPWLPRSRRPHTCPMRSPAAIEQAVVALRRGHPAWGGRKIAHILCRDQHLIVAPSTVTSILHRYGLIAAASSTAHPWHRFEHVAPNRLWQMDFKGHFAVGAYSGHSVRCHPLTVLDDHSRFNIVLHACSNEQGQTVQYALREAFQRYGLPLQINTDNGPPWGTSGQGVISRLGVWLARLGILLTHSAAYHPQTNGKEERFHKTLNAEVLHQRHFTSIQQVQRALDAWRVVYNTQRPHESLAMQTPIQRYHMSARPWPKTLPAIEYAPGDMVRKVQQGGSISFGGHELHLSKALTGESIALRPYPAEDGLFAVFFCHQCIAQINMKHV